MKVRDLKDILCGTVDVISESLDEELAVACSPACIVAAFADERVVDMRADFNPEFGATLVLRIA